MGSPDRSDFEAAVLAVLSDLKPGEVVSYGEVAAAAGFPGAARAVGNLLRACEQPVPWWRVVAATGRLAPGKECEQAALLRAEGIRAGHGRVLAGP
ncbi:MAG: MGMT family protein [Actinobacteria bacterium]|jgi:methylated-DNA-protein-cysteine methyltransferase-like protein|nr:MGMT family protein [Actinomycetota bacterium]